MKRFIPFLFLAVALLALFLWGRERILNGRAKYSGTIEAEEAALGSKIGGRVLSVHVKEGDAVKAGDLLIRLDRETLEAQVRKAEAVLEEARVDLKESAIIAPSDGVVESCRLNPGDLIEPHQTPLTLLLHAPLWVRIFVPESHL